MQIDGPLDLAGAAPSPGCAADLVRLEVTRGSVPAFPADAAIEFNESSTGRHYAVSRAGSSWVVTFPGKAAVRWGDGDDVLHVVAADVPDALLSLLVAGPALTGLLVVRGASLLHASAVLLPPGSDGAARAVAFAGPSGTGKSAVAHLLSSTDTPLLSDDALRLDVRGARVTAHRGTVRSRLRRGSPVHTPLAQDEVISEDGRRVLDPGFEAPGTAALRLFVVPRLSPSFDQVRIRRLSPMEAVMTLATCWPVEGIRSPELLRSQLAVAAEVVPLVPVVEAEVPWRPSEAPPVHALRDALVRVVDLEGP